MSTSPSYLPTRCCWRGIFGMLVFGGLGVGKALCPAGGGIMITDGDVSDFSVVQKSKPVPIIHKNHL